MISPPLQINLSKNQIESVFLPRSAWARACARDNHTRTGQKRGFLAGRRGKSAQVLRGAGINTPGDSVGLKTV